MIAWLTTLSLRVKLYALGAAAVLLLVLGLWGRMRLATARAARLKSRAETLEATHRTEVDIAVKRQRLRERQDKLRAEIRKRTGRDHFQDHGWGP